MRRFIQSAFSARIVIRSHWCNSWFVFEPQKTPRTFGRNPIEFGTENPHAKARRIPYHPIRPTNAQHYGVPLTLFLCVFAPLREALFTNDNSRRRAQI